MGELEETPSCAEFHWRQDMIKEGIKEKGANTEDHYDSLRPDNVFVD